ncbi:ABC transporter permease [Phycicoccus endophyticus]|uniref:ABC transporter permease n=1 Tax=Phycicoccus endophyticus TaxID=1690220 RepID=A0A7G9R287_9MICO|nr:ABC transporter permease [Phycicoccus endophyticus]NHI19628.1 ABC transporter permease [Phycicoccus endophyticus]QNN49712.1 ABC transporter permease [Phycicoccus endophyticus]GGL34408.1 hypothetical protein GCM10012283_16010 [Phycicoccus endophyticus]
MSAVWRLATAGARAHRGGLVGPALALGLASTLLTVTGVLLETGLRAASAAPLSSRAVAGAQLTTLASSFAGTALVVVVLVVATTVSLALRRRREELALLRAVGATRGQVRRIVASEVLQVGLVAAPLGAVPGLLLARAMTPLLRDAALVAPDADPVLSPLPVLGAVLVLLPTALAAGWLAARETLRPPPTAAVREAEVEQPALGRRRSVAAAVTAVLGLAAAGTPLVVPGLVGSAAAASSALLLVVAAALAGPLLLAWGVERCAPLLRGTRHAPVRLAADNLQGFSRRLTAVVVPLALVVAVGAVQTSTDAAVSRAARAQLDAALGGDLVVTGGQGVPPEVADSVAGLPGVRASAPMATSVAEVRTDEDDLGGLSWETVSVRVLDPGTPATLLDPGVTAGSLAALSRAGTVAVSTDSALETGAGVGDELMMRLGQERFAARVVAVYDRGVGLGGYLIGRSTPAAHRAPTTIEALLVAADDPGVSARVRDRAAAAGLSVTTPGAYAGEAGSAEDASQRLETVLLLMLLVFVALGATDALVLTTVGRRRELALLHRTGATPRQLVVMTVLEALATGATAWAVGTVAVLPALLGVAGGLLGTALPVLDVPVYLTLSIGALALTLGASVPAGMRTIRAVTRLAT